MSGHCQRQASGLEEAMGWVGQAILTFLAEEKVQISKLRRADGGGGKQRLQKDSTKIPKAEWKGGVGTRLKFTPQ